MLIHPFSRLPVCLGHVTKPKRRRGSQRQAIGRHFLGYQVQVHFGSFLLSVEAGSVGHGVYAPRLRKQTTRKTKQVNNCVPLEKYGLKGHLKITSITTIRPSLPLLCSNWLKILLKNVIMFVMFQCSMLSNMSIIIVVLYIVI